MLRHRLGLADWATSIRSALQSNVFPIKTDNSLDLSAINTFVILC